MNDERSEPTSSPPHESDPSPAASPPEPVEDEPVEGLPAQRAPAEGAPAEGAPAEGAPAEGAPTEGAPTEGASAEEGPASEPPPQSLAQSPRSLRPWYFVTAMFLSWLVAVVGAKQAYDQASYLRGSTELVDTLREQGAKMDKPLEQLVVLREGARLEALAVHHRRAFPLKVAQLLLFMGLALASLMALSGRKGARSYALQLIAANAVLSSLAFGVLTPVREAIIAAVEEDVAELVRWSLRLELGFALTFYGAVAFALTRARTKRYFDAVQAALAKAEQHDSRE